MAAAGLDIDVHVFCATAGAAQAGAVVVTFMSLEEVVVTLSLPAGVAAAPRIEFVPRDGAGGGKQQIPMKKKRRKEEKKVRVEGERKRAKRSKKKKKQTKVE